MASRVYERGLALLLVYGVAGCAGTRALESQPAQPLVASLEPVASETPAFSAPRPSADDDNLSAGDWLDSGFRFLRRGEHEAASGAFTRALRSGQLNDAGRALAYWNVFVAEQALGREDQSAEALSSFVTVSEDLVGGSAGNPPWFDELVSDFVDNFGIETRLARARAILAAQWFERAPQFGRSAAQPVPVRTGKEKAFFLDLVPPCKNVGARTIRTEHLDELGAGRMERVTLSCAAAPRGVAFYFEFSDSDQ